MKKISLILLLAMVGFQSFAQDETPEKTEDDRKFKKENLFFGGNFGLSFGNYTQIIVSPQVGYRFNPYFAAGVGVNAQYVGIKSFDGGGYEYSKQTQGVYGGNLFARFYPIKQAFLQVQPEVNYITGKFKYLGNYSSYPEQKFSNVAPSLLIGAGVGLGGAYISLMYDVIQDPNTPYSNRPFLNIGFGF